MKTLSEYPLDIHVIGAGGIGTHVLLALLEQEAQTVHLWDDDLVEAHNLPTQFLYRRGDIDTPKVLAAAHFAAEHGFSTEVIPHVERVGATTKLSGIVISGVDSMASRQEIWKAIRFNALVELYLDGRIGGDTVQLFTVDPTEPDHVETYETWLPPDSDVPDLGCVTRQNPHLALGVSSMVSAHLILHLEDKPMTVFLHRNQLSESTKRSHPVAVRS